MPQTSFLVLAAEDVASDAELLQLAFRRSKLPVQLTIVSDGEEAVSHLAGDDPRPALILLDLKMPRMDGFDVLAWLQTQPKLSDIPAIVLTSSSDESDVRRARHHGARDFFVKPLMLDELTTIVRTICGRWLQIAR